MLKTLFKQKPLLQENQETTTTEWKDNKPKGKNLNMT